MSGGIRSLLRTAGGRKQRSREERYRQLEENYKELLRERQLLMSELVELRCSKQDYLKGREEMEQLHEHARQLKHDMRNHLMVIASYLNAGETEEARQYTSQILDKLNLEYSYIETGNTLLNYIINQKLSTAKERGIYVKAEVENLKFEGIKSIDFSAMLGNLLDNALDAAEASHEKCVELAIRRMKGYQVIKISNSIDTSVLAGNPELLTTKSDCTHHGVGIREIREIVERYSGMLDIYEEEGRFIVAIYL